MLFESEGGDSHGGAAQDSCTGGVVDVEILVGGACIPVHEMVQQVVGQRGSGATVGAAGDVAPGS